MFDDIMKYKLAIIYGITMWVLIILVNMLLNSLLTNHVSIPYLNMVIPLFIIIIIIFFSILYIRNFNSNELLEGLKLGIVFIIINMIGDYIFFIILNNTFSIIGDYSTYIFFITFLIIMVTTFIGYLAQMTIELR